jgi:hypothetical protein
MLHVANPASGSLHPQFSLGPVIIATVSLTHMQCHYGM